MSKGLQRHDQTLRSFASLLTVEKDVQNVDLENTPKTFRFNNVVREMFKFPLKGKGENESNGPENDVYKASVRTVSSKERFDNSLTEQIPTSPMLKGFLSSYGFGLNDTTCLLPSLRIQDLEKSRESIPTAVLRSFLKAGNPFPPATSYAKGKKKLQQRRRRSSKISLSAIKAAIEEDQEVKSDPHEYTFERLVEQMSEALFHSTPTTSSTADTASQNHEKTDITTAPHLINLNIRSAIQTLMEARMKYFMEVLVRKSIIKNNGAVTEGAAAVLSHNFGANAPTEISDQIQILENWRKEGLKCKENKEASTKSPIQTASNEGTKGQTEEEKKMMCFPNPKMKVVQDVTFLSDLKSTLKKKCRKAMVIKKCVTSFDVPRGVVGSVVRLRRQSMGLGIGKSEKEGGLNVTNEKNGPERESKGNKSNDQLVNEKDSPTVVPTTEVTLPLTFAVIIEADMGWNNSQNFVIEFGCLGEIKGTFGGPTASCVLTGVNVTLDTESLLKEMENKIRFVIRRAMVIAMNSGSKKQSNNRENDVPATDKQLTLEKTKNGPANKRVLSPSNPIEKEEIMRRQSIQAPDYDTNNEANQNSKNTARSIIGCAKAARAANLIRNGSPASDETDEHEQIAEASSQLFPKPTTHLNNLHGLSSTTKKAKSNTSAAKTALQTFAEAVGKVPEMAVPLPVQGRMNGPAHSCSALNEKKRKFSMQHAKTAAALSQETNGIATSGPGGIRVIPTRLINLSQAHKNSNGNPRRDNPMGRRATMDMLGGNNDVSVDMKSKNYRRSSMPLVSEYESIKVGPFDVKNSSSENVENESSKGNEKIENVLSLEVSPESSKKKQSDKQPGPKLGERKVTAQLKDDSNRLAVLNGESDASEESDMKESKKRKCYESDQNSDDSLEQIESMATVETSVLRKKKKTDKTAYTNANIRPQRRTAIVVDDENETPKPLFKLGSMRQRRGGISMKGPDSSLPETSFESHRQRRGGILMNAPEPSLPEPSFESHRQRRGGILMNAPESSLPETPFEGETINIMRRRRSSGNQIPGEGLNSIDAPLAAESLLSVRRRSSSNHMAAADRRRSSSNSMAAAAEVVRRMEFERRRSSSNSMAAAAEIVRRMEEADRRRSSSNSMAAAAEIVRRMEFERRRSSSASMAAAAEVVRRMEERRRSSSTSMAAAADIVRRMEFERRRSSSASMAAAAEVVRRMESSLVDEDSIAAVRRRSSGGPSSMAASAEAVRKMEASLTAESLMAARRRSSGGPSSMAAAANSVRRMEASLGIDSSPIDAAMRLDLEKDSPLSRLNDKGSHGPYPGDFRRRLSGNMPMHGYRGTGSLNPESLNSTSHSIFTPEMSLQLQLERELATKQIEQGLVSHQDPNGGMYRRRGSFQRRVSFDPELMAQIINGDIGEIDDYPGPNVPDVTQLPPGLMRARRPNLSVQEMAALGLLE